MNITNTLRNSPGKEKVTALIVTCNRKELLKECLDAIFSQTYPVNKAILIDNASNDGTGQMLKDAGYLDYLNFDYYKMDNNLGGAGGFYEGIVRAMEDKEGWVWLMDDDTIPTNDCLESLLNANNIIRNELSVQASFYASTIYGPDGECMNVPAINNSPGRNGYPYWYTFLNKGIISIKCATFVSILINKNAIIHCGYPCRDYYIWGDDTEYTTRLSTYFGDAFFVGNSVAIHKRSGAKKLAIENETDLQRIKMYSYYYRNTIINKHYYNDNYRGGIFEMIKTFLKARKFLGDKLYGWERFKTAIKGSWAGIRQFKDFRDYIDEEIAKGRRLSDRSI